MNYAEFHRRSLEDRDGFWSEQAALIDWHTPFTQVCDYSNPPFAKWFVGGTTNLCHNAVDRHLATRADQNALIFVSTETGTERCYSFRELHAEVQRMAATLKSLGVKKGDRVLVYMPMIPEAAFAMLACTRIGALHSVVFGGFASGSLASRIDDAEPTVIVSADAGSRGGKVVPYKGLLDEAIRLAAHKPAKVLMVDRGLSPMPMTAISGINFSSVASTCGFTSTPTTRSPCVANMLAVGNPIYPRPMTQIFWISIHFSVNADRWAATGSRSRYYATFLPEGGFYLGCFVAQSATKQPKYSAFLAGRGQGVR